MKLSQLLSLSDKNKNSNNENTLNIVDVLDIEGKNKLDQNGIAFGFTEKMRTVSQCTRGKANVSSTLNYQYYL